MFSRDSCRTVMSATTMPSSPMPICLPLAMTAATYPARAGVISISSPEVEEVTDSTVEVAVEAATAVDVEQAEVFPPKRQVRAVV
jgi:hypothetical protein